MLSLAIDVHGMFLGAPSETEGHECAVELGVPCARGLTEGVQRLVEAQDLVFTPGDGEAGGLGDVHFLCKIAIQERRFDVEVMNLPAFMRRHGKQRAHRVQPRHRREHFVKVHAGALDVALCHQARLVPHNGTGGVLLKLKTHLRPMGQWLVGRSTACQVPLPMMEDNSLCIVARQAGSVFACSNEVGSSEATGRSSSGSSSLGSEVLMQSTTVWYLRGAPSSSRSISGGTCDGGVANLIVLSLPLGGV